MVILAISFSEAQRMDGLPKFSKNFVITKGQLYLYSKLRMGLALEVSHRLNGADME